MTDKDEEVQGTNPALPAKVRIGIGQVRNDIGHQKDRGQDKGHDIGQPVQGHIFGFNHPIGHGQQDRGRSVQDSMEEGQTPHIG